MLTYVINTSENKTFESDELFKLVGYNKICWLNCRLNEVQKLAEEIAEKQNVIDADKFRVAVIVDFYGYNKVRLPYGFSCEGYSQESGVDLNIYFPFIEMYLKDHLFDWLAKKEVRPYNCEIFYIQDEKYEKYDFLDNRISQTSQVLYPVENGDCVNLFEKLEDYKATISLLNKIDKIIETLTPMKKSDDGSEKESSAEQNIKEFLKELASKRKEIEQESFTAEKLADYNEKLSIRLESLQGNKKYQKILDELFVECCDENAFVQKELKNIDNKISIDEIIRRDFSKLENFASDEDEFINDDKNEVNGKKEGKVKKEEKPKKKECDYKTESEKCLELFCEKRYSTFRLFCTDLVSLDFKITDYPYGDFCKMSFDEFLRAFVRRSSVNNHITIHKYYTIYSDNPAKSAFDTLSLSLYLIRAYEREAEIESDKDFYKREIDVSALKDRLVKCWNKIGCARKVAQSNDSHCYYYSLKSFANNDLVYNEASDEGIFSEVEKSVKVITYNSKEESKVINKYKKDKDKNKDYDNYIFIPEEVDLQVEKINQFYNHDKRSLTESQLEDIEKSMKTYFESRNTTMFSEDIQEYKNDYVLNSENRVSQCPSKQEYERILHDKEKQISDYFDHVLNTQYLQVDYEEEKKQADNLYKDYKKNVKMVEKKFVSDIFLGLFAVLIMVVPYILLRSMSSMFTLEAALLYLYCIGIFGGLFFLMIFVYNVSLWQKVLKQKRGIRKALISCNVKSKSATKALRTKYTSVRGQADGDLIRIEKARYEIRQLTKLYEENLLINERIKGHRELLEDVEDKLSCILNNLGVQPVLDTNEKIEGGEFDITKPYLSSDNKVYKIFSIESIESMFKKGDDKKWLA